MTRIILIAALATASLLTFQFLSADNAAACDDHASCWIRTQQTNTTGSFAVPQSSGRRR